MAELTPTEPCCEVWPKLLLYFGWFQFDDAPELLAMPHFESPDLWRVNYCPSCGAEVRDCIVRWSDVEEDA